MDSEYKRVIWQMSCAKAIEFFEICEAREAVTEEEKIKILVEMGKQGKLQRVWATKKSKEEFIKHLSREHKVLHVKPKE